jgi:hypothetical protein
MSRGAQITLLALALLGCGPETPGSAPADAPWQATTLEECGAEAIERWQPSPVAEVMDTGWVDLFEACADAGDLELSGRERGEIRRLAASGALDLRTLSAVKR